MSVRHLAAVADLTEVSPTCKLLLFALAVNADPTGWSTASMRSLIRTSGLSERSVRNTLKRLKDLELIEKQSGFRVKLQIPA